MRSIISVICFAFLSVVHANPTAPNIISGNAIIDMSDPSNITVQCNSDRTIIEWDSFSIGTLETATFQVSTTGAAIVNRVTGNSSSDIGGTLMSNGLIFLVNSNGVIIEPSAVIQANGFVAASLDADNASFIQSNQITFFAKAITPVAHYGNILAYSDDVALLGNPVINQGMVSVNPNRLFIIGQGTVVTIPPLDDPDFTNLTIVSPDSL